MPQGTYELVQLHRRCHRPDQSPGAARCWRRRPSTGAPRSPSRSGSAGADRSAARPGCHPGGPAAPGVRAVPASRPTICAKWVYLANLRDRNEVLFYRLLTEHISEMLPVVYTPTVGLAIERFSQEFRRTRGVYLSVDHPEDVETALRNTGLGAGRRGPAGGHRLRGHPGHRRPGRRRHRDLHRQARRLHRGRRHPPAPGAAGGAGHGHRQPEAAQRRDVPGCAARPGPRPAVRRPDRRLRHRVQQAVPARDAALGGLRRHQRPPHPEQVRRPGLHVQRRHAGHRGVGAGRGVLRGAGRRDPDARPADRHPRRRHRRAGHRGHDARPDDPRGAVAGGGDPAVLPAGQPRAAGRRPADRPAGLPAALRPARGTRSRTGRAGRRRHRPGRGGRAGCTRRC